MNEIIDRILSFIGHSDVLIYKYKSFYSVAEKDGESFVFDLEGFPEAMNFSEIDPSDCKNPRLVYK